MRPGLKPEDHRRDIAGLRRREQKAEDRRIGLRYTAIELITEALAQRFWGAANDFGDVVLRDTETGQVPHLLPQRVIDDKNGSRHVQLLINRGPALRRARRRTDRRLDVLRHGR